MRPRMIAALTAAVLTVAALAGCSNEEDEARDALQGFLDGWRGGTLAEVPMVTPAGAPVAAATAQEQIATLSGELAEQSPELEIASVDVNEGTATGQVEVAWPLPGGATWTYTTPVRLADGDGEWRVIWEPAVVHPQLVDGDELRLQRVAAERGEILDGAGEPLVTRRPVVDVGIWPAKVTDLDSLIGEMRDALDPIAPGLDWDQIRTGVEEADPDDFVYVVTLRREAYDQVRDRIQPLPGTRFVEGELYLAPSRTFARALLGSVDQATAEDLQNNPALAEGDFVGHGGLSGAYDEQLRGVAGQSVVIARPAPDDTTEEIPLQEIVPVDGTDLPTTLDPDVQRAAEQALAAEPNNAALVAIRVSDGSVLAVANTRGEAANDVNLALTGAVAPGSTFKMVTGYGLLKAGEVTLDQPVDCPDELEVEGYPIGNAFPEDRGEIPFREAMAISCNTAFAGLSSRLGPDGLAAAAADLGIGGDWNLGLETFTGTVASGGSTLDQAQAAYGQGDTQVSTAAMAAATAAVARGAWLPPHLLADAPAAQPSPLPEAAIADLQAAMRAVVTDGTATGLRNTPGGEVYGKTGTAEADELEHAWLVGWQGDVAFAIFVEDGRSGAGTAVPLADDFLRELG